LRVNYKIFLRKKVVRVSENIAVWFFSFNHNFIAFYYAISHEISSDFKPYNNIDT
jgi:hypothetical protein